MKRTYAHSRLSPLFLALALALSGCAVGPHYTEPPAVETPTAFKEGQGEWIRVGAVDALERGPWWTLFGDAELDALASRVEVSNQNVAAAVASYQQAQALVSQQRAALFPSATLTGGANRRGSNAAGSSSIGSTTGTSPGTSYNLSLGASWEADVWGRLGRAVTGARAGEQASAADLAAARLSAQGALAVNYFNLRGADAQRALVVQTIQGFQRALQITTNRYNAGIAARTDVLQAETQLANAQADLLTLDRQRATLEHAIAVLAGQAPASFRIAPRETSAWTVPDVPLSLPSTLLLRRPDIVGAERRVAQANEQIGIAQSAWFPRLQLTGSDGASALAVSDLFRASNLVWALGLSVTQTVFDAGATGSRVAQARAAFDQSAARYRQTVLSAFQDVEDQLTASRVLGEQRGLREQATSAADLVEQQVLNRYQAGQVSFTDVITAQATALTARRSLVQLQSDRQVAAVSLIQSVGGGWNPTETTAQRTSSPPR